MFCECPEESLFIILHMRCPDVKLWSPKFEIMTGNLINLISKIPILEGALHFSAKLFTASFLFTCDMLPSSRNNEVQHVVLLNSKHYQFCLVCACWNHSEFPFARKQNIRNFMQGGFYLRNSSRLCWRDRKYGSR